MAFESFIAFRHLKSRRKRSLSVVSWLAVAGVALGVTALVGGFSVTSGFEVAFREKVLGVTAHVFVREFGFRFDRYRDVDAALQEVEGVRATSPMTFNEAMITGATGTTGSVIKGIAPDRVKAVLDVEAYLIKGRLDDLGRRDPDGLDGIFLGAELAESVGAKTGGVVTLVSPLRSSDPEAWSAEAGAPRTRLFRVRGIFDAGFHEYDARLAFIELSAAQSFFGLRDVITGLEVSVDDPMRAGAVAERIRARLGAGAYSVVDWRTQNRNLFASLTYQRLAILTVLSVMVILASCNVACMLVMLVLERTGEIAILKAMGARKRDVLRVFVVEGMVIGCVGTAIGLLVAYGLFEGLLSQGIALDPKVYGIARLPIVFDPLDYAQAAAGALMITFVTTVFPALRGARLHPVDGLRETHGERG